MKTCNQLSITPSLFFISLKRMFTPINNTFQILPDIRSKFLLYHYKGLASNSLFFPK